MIYCNQSFSDTKAFQLKNNIRTCTKTHLLLRNVNLNKVVRTRKQPREQTEDAVEEEEEDGCGNDEEQNTMDF